MKKNFSYKKITAGVCSLALLGTVAAQIGSVAVYADESANTSAEAPATTQVTLTLADTTNHVRDGKTIVDSFTNETALSGASVTIGIDIEYITPTALAQITSNAAELNVPNTLNFVNEYGVYRSAPVFSASTTLTSANLAGLVTAATDTGSISQKFANAPKLQSIVLPNAFATDVTDITALLANDPALTSVSFPASWKSFAITKIDGLLRNSGVTSVDLSNLDLTKVTSAKNAFEGTKLTGDVVVPTFAAGADVTSLYQNVKGITSVDATSLNGGTTTNLLQNATNVTKVIIGENFTDLALALDTGNRNMVVIVPEDYDTTELTSYTKALTSDYKILGITDEDGDLENTFTTITPKQVFTQAEYDALTVDKVTADIDANTKLSDAAKTTLKNQLSQTDATNKVELDRLDQVANYQNFDINSIDITTSAAASDGATTINFVANKKLNDTVTLHVKKSVYVPGTGFVTYDTDKTVTLTVPNGLVWNDETNQYEHSSTYDEDLNTAAEEAGVSADSGFTFDESEVAQPELTYAVSTNAPAVEDEYDNPTLIEYNVELSNTLADIDNTLKGLQGKSADEVAQALKELKEKYPNVTFTETTEGNTIKISYTVLLDDTHSITSEEITIKLAPVKVLVKKRVEKLAQTGSSVEAVLIASAVLTTIGAAVAVSRKSNE